MRKTSRLLSWLKDASDSGTFDSSGSITLSEEKAREKLSGFQVAEEEAWVTKALQLSNLMDSDLKVELDGAGIRLVFESCLDWSAETVSQCLFHPDRSGSQALECLSMVVRLLERTQRYFAVVHPEKRWLWNGETLMEDVRPSSEFRIEASFTGLDEPKGMWSVFNFKPKRRMLKIQEKLEKEAVYSAKGVKIDGILKSGLFCDPHMGIKKDSRPIFLWRHVNAEQGLPKFWVRTGPVKETARIHRGLISEFADREHQEWQVSAAGLVSVFFRGETPTQRNSELVWLRHGVPILRETLPHRGVVAASVVVDTAGLDTDLSTLSLRQTPFFEERRLLALRELSSWLSQGWDEVQQVHICQSLVALTEPTIRRQASDGTFVERRRSHELVQNLIRDIECLREYNFVEACRR